MVVPLTAELEGVQGEVRHQPGGAEYYSQRRVGCDKPTLPVVRLSCIALVGYLLIMSRRIVWIPGHDQLLGRIRFRRTDTVGP